ncbi:hypothetical protein TNCV_2868361 [Trichonephila clavipes]|nr:hypothetical protein TNCV_2868361 [Trichonephila clavipes]
MPTNHCLFNTSRLYRISAPSVAPPILTSKNEKGLFPRLLKFLSWVIVKNTKIKQQEKAEANVDRSSKARRGVMDALSTYQKRLTKRKRKTLITLDAFLIKRQRSGITEDTV